MWFAFCVCLSVLVYLIDANRMERKEHDIELVVTGQQQNWDKSWNEMEEKTTTDSLTKFQRTASVCIIHAITAFFVLSQPVLHFHSLVFVPICCLYRISRIVQMFVFFLRFHFSMSSSLFHAISCYYSSQSKFIFPDFHKLRFKQTAFLYRSWQKRPTRPKKTIRNTKHKGYNENTYFKHNYFMHIVHYITMRPNRIGSGKKSQKKYQLHCLV